MKELPVSQNAPFFFFDLELEETTYRFEFLFNTRAGKWFMNLRDSSGEAIVLGLCVVIGSSILEPYAHRGVPPGVLFAYDTTEKGIDPDLYDLGERVKLYYVESTEL